jgi:hypothetical protein
MRWWESGVCQLGRALGGDGAAGLQLAYLEALALNCRI